MTLRATSTSVFLALASFGCGQASTSEDIAEARAEEDAGGGDKSGKSSPGDDDSGDDDSGDDDSVDDDASDTSAPRR